MREIQFGGQASIDDSDRGTSVQEEPEWPSAVDHDTDDRYAELDGHRQFDGTAWDLHRFRHGRDRRGLAARILPASRDQGRYCHQPASQEG
jgi:hypothetical protein